MSDIEALEELFFESTFIPSDELVDVLSNYKKALEILLTANKKLSSLADDISAGVIVGDKKVIPLIQKVNFSYKAFFSFREQLTAEELEPEWLNLSESVINEFKANPQAIKIAMDVKNGFDVTKQFAQYEKCCSLLCGAM